MYNLLSPIEVTIEITKKCNLNCIQCFSAEDRAKKEKQLSNEELLELGTDLGKLKVFTVVFSGGEPLLHKDFFILVSHYISKGIDVGFSTNGTIINEEIAKKIKQHGLGKEIQVSVDGSNAMIHDKIRGKGSFVKTLKGIRSLVGVDIHPSIAVTILNQNIDDAEGIINFALKEKCKHVHFMFLMPSGNANKYFDIINPKRKQIIDLSLLLKKKRDEVKGKITIDWGNLDHCPTSPDLSPSKYSEIDKLYAGCPAGKVKALIDAFGNVFGCDILRDKQFIAGNIRETSFKDIWLNSQVFDLWRNRSVNTIRGRCAKCYYLFACVGGCPAFSVAKGGDIFDSDPTCDKNYNFA